MHTTYHIYFIMRDYYTYYYVYLWRFACIRINKN